ncbi:hypothetical protein IGI04_002871 [Brassica rapa subsp. trilocularis]|uniref:Uncharacterized protein n=1 Tax=Brassica rapa subsp. trilocularis TaxID=1813537 RepID=A0ABQ7MMM9_BRACM|nr:hypothetical protein IGI04_020959 [Brassica rapa subsp. trilocularis]KAG5399365.1 hypothetical protein IGI04_021179 [Brassica rapa subsp. trilocularis]KAG5405854.1 hypothetical protein IGI04_011973 [Brassica rapa subsp. trilocularis]KAG5412621.1 hypothetical protein IGI04_000188 [Brassica rapa subsp. trilocularis]KAG5414013.1 hypothetical protein IGI04_001580 [Brassica rapa subsp. trilocularis]
MLWIHSLNLSVAAPPLGPPPAPRLWENDQLSKYGDTKTARTVMLAEAKPSYSQTTHCAVPNGPLALLSVNQPVTTLTKPTAFPLLGAHGVRNLNPFPPVTVVSAANAPTGPVYRKVWYNHLILPYYHLVSLFMLGKIIYVFSTIVQSCRTRVVCASIRLSGPVCEKTHSRTLNRVLGRDKWNFILKLTLEKSWDYDQHFHANMILDSKRKDNSFKTGKNNDNRSYDY